MCENPSQSYKVLNKHQRPPRYRAWKPRVKSVITKTQKDDLGRPRRAATNNFCGRALVGEKRCRQAQSANCEK